MSISHRGFFLSLDGDLGGFGNAETALAKQKHRMIWERRYGPVGSGKNNDA